MPHGDILERAILKRLEAWASFRDPDSERSKQVASLASQIYEGLAQVVPPECAGLQRICSLLRASALMRAVGSSGRGKRSSKKSAQEIRKLPTPIGWMSGDLDLVALAVRYHRGSLPAPEDKGLSMLSPEQQRIISILSGMLRQVEAFTVPNGSRVSSLSVSPSGQYLMIRAGGYQAYSSRALKLARARHLLEVASDRPVIIRAK